MFTTVFTVLIASLAIGFAVSIIILYHSLYTLSPTVSGWVSRIQREIPPSAGRELLPDGSQRHPPLWIMDLPQSSGILMPGL